eukprot:scaffold555_cov158-Skeletonema_menzelii.AAC.15
MSSSNDNDLLVEESQNNNNGDDLDQYPDDAGRSINLSTSMSPSQPDEEPESHFMEGYTPLNFNMNDMISMNDDSESDGETEMNGEEYANNGYYHMLGAPPKRINGVKHHAMGYSVGHDDHENNNNEDDNDSASFEIQNTADTTSSDLEIPIDFLSLAEQALRGLEDEHRTTLELSSAHIPTIGDADTRPIPKDDEVVAASIPPPSTHTIAQVNEGGDEKMTTNFESIFPPLEDIASVEVSKLEPKPMDVNAIQKAMHSIRLKSPQLANTLDAGASSSFSPSSTVLQTSLGSVINFTSQSIQSMERQNINNHAIIPAGPLAAFRRSTPKAKSASANLSRSATLSEAVLQTLRKSVGPFARWMSAALQSGVLTTMQTSSAGSAPEINSLVLEISGPNVPDWILSREINLLPSSELGGLVSATAVFHQREYHEQTLDEGSVVLTPDLAVAFNAGIWGYDSWKPTLSFMCQSESNDSYACIPFIITAYTIEECEDDAEVIAEVAEEAAVKRMQSSKHDNAVCAHQLWAPESNPFSSRIERKTASVPRKYYENNAWQAWLLGPSTSAT